MMFLPIGVVNIRYIIGSYTVEKISRPLILGFSSAFYFSKRTDCNIPLVQFLVKYFLEISW